MIERKYRLQTAFEFLRNQGKVHTQKDVARIMQTTEPNISAALKGSERVLTDKFLRRFNTAFNNIFSDNWLISGEGEMLQPAQNMGNISNSNLTGVNVNGKEIHINPDAYNTLLKIVENNQKSTEKFQEQIDRLITLLEKK